MSVAKGCATSQEGAFEFPLEGSTPSCPLRDGLDLSSTRPQPGGGEPLSSSHLHHRPLDPAEVDPPKAAHLRTFAPCTLHKLADRQGHLFGVVSQFLILWDHLKSPDTTLVKSIVESLWGFHNHLNRKNIKSK